MAPQHHRIPKEPEEEGEEVVLVEKEDPPSSAEEATIAAAVAKKEAGNAYFSSQKYEQAAASYREGLEILDGLSSAREIHVSLYSNLAMVAIKVKQFEEAERCCTTAITQWDDSVAKVWFRRGNAREELGRLEEALEDFKISVRLLQKQKQSDLTRTAVTAMSRVDAKIKRSKACSPLAINGMANHSSTHSSTPTMNGHAAATPPVSITPTPSMATPLPPPPPPEQQKQDVLRLLIGRSVSLKQQQPSSIPAGEALLMMDWQWWCQWCRHVDFFSQDKVERVLNLLVAGATAVPPAKPTPKRPTDKNDDDDSSTDSEDEDDPGPIDNSALLMPTEGPSARFYQHWYPHFRKGDPPLRPNLVRGFHYEILPREVYAALSQWYGEITPRILRRTVLGQNGTLQLDLYAIDDKGKVSQQQRQQRTSQQCSACRARSATKRCTRCLVVWYCDRTCQEAHWSHHKQDCSKIAQERKNNPQTDYVLRLSDGRVGLNNMGNTCFMNSALQCLSHAAPLTRHFLSNQFLQDLNPNNPLGTGGKLAHAFESCLKELWWKHQTSTSPTALKRAIALFAPRFAGCLQHDAQEFLAYLLDGLHEDLNRIKKAPYVEMPDFDDNGAATQVNASLAWDCHLRRNDSLILDTFYGQFKSTCVCPCGRVSVSFDAFNHVSLEIPQLQQSTVWLSFLVFGGIKNDANAAVKYGLGLRRGSIVADIRQALAKSFQVPQAHMIICEISDNAIVEILRDEKPVSTIGPNDNLSVYLVEPYTCSSIHVICTHSVLDKDSRGNVNRELFGIPFMTSCDANLTCRQLWDHVWGEVRRLVVPLTEDGTKVETDLDADLEEVYKQLLKVRVTDGDGNSMPLFPGEVRTQTSNPQEEEKNEDEGEESPRSPYVPRDSDDQIKDFLGQDCTTRFLFLFLEWKVEMNVPQELLQKNATPAGGGSNNKKKKKMKKNNANKGKHIPPKIGILEKRFTALGDHPSHHECLKRKREMEAARGVSLDQCFETFTKPERLDEHNMWYCSNCKMNVRALKTMELWRLPNILVLHLKRFEFRHGYRRDKLTTFVDFPMDGLDMSKHCAQFKDDGQEPPDTLHINDGIPAIYDLFGVVNHYGRMGFGHYTAFARQWDEEEISSDWGLFDDSSARSVGDGRGSGGVVDGVVSPAAYVLFYRRRTFN